MTRFLNYLYTLYFFGSSFLLFFVNVLITTLALPFDPNRRASHMFSCWWGFHYIQIVPTWKVRFEGVEHIEKGKTYVLISNHQSYFDIMVLYGLYRFFKWVSKEEIFKIPIVGWNMYLNQYVMLRRGDLKSIKEMMATCHKWLKQGASILIFPEGTRTETGQIGEFRDGPFKIASDADVPVVPIVLDGTFNIYPKHRKAINFHTDIVIRVLPPMHVSSFDGSVRKMREYTRDLMIATLEDLRQRNASQPRAGEEEKVAIKAAEQSD